MYVKLMRLKGLRVLKRRIKGTHVLTGALSSTRLAIVQIEQERTTNAQFSYHIS
jgi:hypothetical protein